LPTGSPGFEIQQCYRHLLYPSRNGLGEGTVTLAHAVIDIQNASEKPGSGQTQVVRQLQSQNKLRDASDQPDSPAYIRDRTPRRSACGRSPCKPRMVLTTVGGS
jgi:hypothetical protein